MNLRDLIQRGKGMQKSNILNSFGQRSISLYQLEKAKPHPVGYINKWHEMKMPDGSWKYVGKRGVSHPAAIELKEKGYTVTPSPTETKVEKKVEAKKGKLPAYSSLDQKTKVPAGGSGGAFIISKGSERFIAKVEEKYGDKNLKEQLVSEQLTDSLYKILGISASDSEIQVMDDGRVVKLARFIEDSKTLNTVTYTDLEEKVAKELQKGFVADCLFLNWDVLGQGFDNVLIDKKGVHRIDNGGALLWRAKSGKKFDSSLTREVGEIETMRSEKNPSGMRFFGSITDEEIKRQVAEIVSKKDELLSTIKSKTLLDDREQVAELISGRIDWLKENYLDKKKEPTNITERYFEKFDKLEFYGNEGIKDAIKKQIKAVEERHESDYRRHAKKRGISAEEYKQLLQDRAEELARESSLFRATDEEILGLVIGEGGRYKSQFETGTSHGALSPTARTKAENDYFNFGPEDKNREMRPIYGYASSNKNGVSNYKGEHPPDNNASQYGRVTVKMKDSVRSRTTLSFGDSLGRSMSFACTPIDLPHFTSFDVGDGDPLDILESTARSGRYTELQYHGQLKSEDIESIHVSPVGISGLSISSESAFSTINQVLDTVRKTDKKIVIYGNS